MGWIYSEPGQILTEAAFSYKLYVHGVAGSRSCEDKPVRL